jgi:serine/threonine protein kinase
VSYGASCKVLTCVHRATGKRYAAKAIAKVGWTNFGMVSGLYLCATIASQHAAFSAANTDVMVRCWLDIQHHMHAPKQDPKDPDRQFQNVLYEVGILKEVEDHPNAVKLIEVYNDPRQYYIVMEVGLLLWGQEQSMTNSVKL